jgi:hypothetical protein
MNADVTNEKQVIRKLFMQLLKSTMSVGVPKQLFFWPANFLGGEKETVR